MTSRPSTRQPDPVRHPKRGDERIVRLFPLTGTLLLPGTYLPLNVFEPRYLAMVEDALESDGAIGMIQPLIPALDNMGPVAGQPTRPELYEVGCLGEITDCERQPDGRCRIVLQGTQRFRVRRELEAVRGYRRVMAESSEFDRDLTEEETELSANRVLAGAMALAERLEIGFDEDLLAALSSVALVNALSVALPLSAVERQALLEAAGPVEREELLFEMIRMQLGSDLPATAETRQSGRGPGTDGSSFVN